MHPTTDPLEPSGADMTRLDAATAAPAPSPTAASAGGAMTPTAPATGEDGIVEAFDPERLLLGEHGGVAVIVGLLLLALVLLTVAFGSLPR
ncbi:MAG: hypothetical protein KAH46_30565 [Mycobacterium sp.]|nr:hypothetical protein [Mycobacterium sp.]